GLPTASSAWVSFPGGDGLVTSLPNEASFEIWVVWSGGAIWQEMFDFGEAATPGYSLGGYQYVMICPYDGATGALRAEWDQNPTYDFVLTGPALEARVLSQVVWTHDQDRQLDHLYRNGQLVATGVNTALWSSLPDTDNWMARDEWADPMFAGAYADFRIWNGALTAGQVANLYQAGPKVIVGPALTITAEANQITLQWPANATGFTLQSTTSLVGGTWTAVTGTPTVLNGLNTLTAPASPSHIYYRLKQ
ncbi:MAG TPA: LamG domain-containing protein, partial [Candidatus Acidoferrales bacterium]|nr:LamG domain-containing protein [Candidatus Acidoferrales bacterium]